MQRQQYGRCGDLRSLDRLRGHPLFVSAHIRAGAVSGTECRRRSRGRGRRRQVPRWRDEGNGGRGRSEQRERGPFRALKMRPVRQVLLLARHASETASGAAGGGFHAPGASENASGAAGGCPQSVESAVLRAFEDASRTTGACFWHRISLPYRRSLFCAPSASENASRTPGGCFCHRISLLYRKSLF